MAELAKLDGFRCKMPKCRFAWIPRKGLDSKPERCPKCKSKLWDRGPRTRAQITEAARRAVHALWAKRRAKSVNPAQRRMFA